MFTKMSWILLNLRNINRTGVSSTVSAFDEEPLMILNAGKITGTGFI